MDAGDGLAGFVLGGTHPIAAHVLITLERLGEDRDPPQPLHVGHAVPPRHDQAQGRAVLWQKGGAVHLVREQDVVAERIGEREGTFVVLLHLALDAVVGTGEGDLDRARPDPRLLEHTTERCARPFGVSHRLEQPRLAHRPWLVQGSSVPRALERHRERNAWPRAEILERQFDGRADVPADLEPPRGWVDVRDVVVDQEVVQPGGGDVVAEGLERHAVVARCELQLLARDALSAYGFPHVRRV